MISKFAIGSLAVALVQAGRCPFGYGRQEEAVQLNTHQAPPQERNLLQFGGGGFGSSSSSNSRSTTSQSSLGTSSPDIASVARVDYPATADVINPDSMNTVTVDPTTGQTTTIGGPDPISPAMANCPNVHYPAELLTCTGKNKVMATTDFSKAEYEQIFNDVVAHYDQTPVKDQTGMAACLVRLAGHDFMDYRLGARGVEDSTGGSDGCVNFQDPDNKGLCQCITRADIQTVYHKWCDKVSLADFIVIAAESVTARLATGYQATSPFAEGTMATRFRDQLSVGRQTMERCPTNVGLMPNPENGCDALQNIFVDHIYKEKWNKRLPWKLTAAISGAHTLGQAHVENSGYDGHWSPPDQQGKFNNFYYKNMLKHGWGPERNISGNADKNQWERVDQLPCVEEFHEMMLNTDLCLAYQFNQKHIDCMRDNGRNVGQCNKFQKKGRFLNGKNDSCCAWMDQNVLFQENRGPIIEKDNNDFCGINASNGNLRGVCCQHEASGDDCDAMNWPKGVAFDHILEFAGKEDVFYTNYLEAWKRAVNNGFPKPLQPLTG